MCAKGGQPVVYDDGKWQMEAMKEYERQQAFAQAAAQRNMNDNLYKLAMLQDYRAALQQMPVNPQTYAGRPKLGEPLSAVPASNPVPTKPEKCPLPERDPVTKLYRKFLFEDK